MYTIFKERKMITQSSHQTQKHKWHFTQRTKNCRDMTRQRCLSQNSGQWLGNIWGKSMEDRGYFSRCVCTSLFQHWLPVSGDKNVLLFLIQGGYLSHEKFYDFLLHRKGSEKCRAPAVAQAGVFWCSMFWPLSYLSF